MKSTMYALMLGIISVTALAKTIETNELQVLIDPNASWSQYAANIGGQITNDPSTPLPAGASFIQNGLIFPRGTVNLSQSSYVVDKNGQPLTELNSVGMFTTNATALSAFDASNPPALGTILDQTSNIFALNGNNNTPNQLFTLGSTELINTPMSGVVVSKNSSSIVGGTGKNQSANGGVTTELHVAPDGQSSLLVVKFDRKVRINIPNKN